MVAPEAGHLQGIGHAAAGFVGDVLDVARYVVVRHQHGVAFPQQALDVGAQGLFAGRTQHGRKMHRHFARLQTVVAQHTFDHTLFDRRP